MLHLLGVESLTGDGVWKIEHIGDTGIRLALCLALRLARLDCLANFGPAQIKAVPETVVVSHSCIFDII